MRAVLLLAFLSVRLSAASVQELLARSAAAEASGDAASAWSFAESAAREAPTSPAVRARAAAMALAAGRPEQARAQADAGLALGAPTPALLQARAAALLALGRAAESLDDAEKALALNPDSEASRRARDLAAAALKRRPRWPLAATGVLLLIGAQIARRQGGRSKRVRFAALIKVPPAGDQLPAGCVLAGRYIAGRLLERGPGTQQCYEGRDLEDRPLLLRRYLPALEARRGFQLARARAAAALKHPGLHPLLDAFEEGGCGYAVEAPAGESLLAALDKSSGRRLPPDAVARASKALCEGLEAAHAAGLTHGRLSAHDIAVSPSGWELDGLGLPGAAHAEYAPPEGDETGQDGDLYALAVCLYEALAGEKPFPGPEGPLAKREGRPASLASAGLPAGLDAFFARALAADPARRFKSALEIHGALRSVVSPAVQ